MLMHCIIFAFSQCFMHLDVCFYVENLCADRITLGWAHDVFFLYTSHAHALFMHTYLFFLIFGTLCWWCFSVCLPFLSLSLSLSLSHIVRAWHPSTKLLCPRTLSFLGHHVLILLLFLSGSAMWRPVKTSLRTSPNMAFIQNAMWFYRTFPILLYLLSFTVGVRNLYGRYLWVVPSWPYRSFTLICLVLILLCLDLLLLFEVHV